VTATVAPVDRSTLRLSEVARHVVIPEGIVDTLWFEVEERCREFGDEFDAWQDGLGQVMLGLREDGMFAATVGGIGMSIPRQVAKTFIVGRTVVALCSLYPDLTVLWTAHRLRTATMTFDKLKGFLLRPAVRPYLEPGRNLGTAIRDANGEQEIPFANGSRIMFGAREQGFGRGFDEVDVEVFDEAQILTARSLEDMVAATNQSRFAHGALLFYMGTPPRPSDGDKGEMFAARRTKALEVKKAGGQEDFGEPVAVGDALFVECSADENVGEPGGPSLDDPQQVAKANPSYPHRTPPVSVARLRENLPDDDSWRREGLGVWDRVDAGGGALSLSAWKALADPTAERGELVAFGADVAEDRTAWVAVAWTREDGSAQVMLGNDGRPMPPGDLAAECARLTSQWGGAVVPPKAFEEDVELAGAAIHKLAAGAFTAGCGIIADRIAAGTIHHGNQAALNDAVKVAKWRSAGTTGERAFQLKDFPEVGPLAAVVRALCGLAASVNEEPAIY
jgi:hypothetical protein